MPLAMSRRSDGHASIATVLRSRVPEWRSEGLDAAGDHDLGVGAPRRDPVSIPARCATWRSGRLEPDASYVRQPPLRMRPHRAPYDISDQRERDESAEPIDANEPIEQTDSNEPAEPIERTDPAEPIDKIDPFEPIDSREFSDHSDQRERELTINRVSHRQVQVTSSSSSTSHGSNTTSPTSKRPVNVINSPST